MEMSKTHFLPSRETDKPDSYNTSAWGSDGGGRDHGGSHRQASNLAWVLKDFLAQGYLR